MLKKTREDAVAVFHAGIRAVAPDAAVKRFCRREGDVLTVGSRLYNLSEFSGVYLMGAGKAGAPMAAAMEALLGEELTGGVIVVKYGHAQPLNKTAVVEAGHPLPDRNGERGADKILNLLKTAGEKDLAIFLLSGGGSALLPKPVPGVGLADKQETTRVLLSCGAAIHEINAVRKHLSAVKGGQLAAAAYPATVVTLILSDVVGDDLDVIASGPTVPDAATFSDCMKIVDTYGISGRLPEPVLRHLKEGVAGRAQETPKSGDPVFEKTAHLIVGSNFEALIAAEKEALGRGYRTLVLSSMIEGETADVARVHTAIAREIAKTGRPVPAPACVISGGETTVTLKGGGLGGRNQHFALCAAPDIAGANPVVILSGGTDGTDGPTDAAGAISDSTTVERARARNLALDTYRAENDAYRFFDALGDLLITGPTRTNVMDLRVLLVPGPVGDSGPRQGKPEQASAKRSMG